MGFLFNSDRFKKNKRKVNPFQLVDDFDYDFAESFEMDDYEINDDFDEFDDVSLYTEEELDWLDKIIKNANSISIIWNTVFLCFHWHKGY